jgi:hypothetical protein
VSMKRSATRPAPSRFFQPSRKIVPRRAPPAATGTLLLFANLSKVMICPLSPPRERDGERGFL